MAVNVSRETFIVCKYFDKIIKKMVLRYYSRAIINLSCYIAYFTVKTYGNM